MAVPAKRFSLRLREMPISAPDNTRHGLERALGEAQAEEVQDLNEVANTQTSRNPLP